MSVLKKSIKVLLFVLGFIIIGLIAYYNYWRSSKTVETFQLFSEPQQLEYHSMYWRSGFIGNQKVEKVALFIETRIAGIDKRFYMQLDTGTPTTVFYENTLNGLNKLFPQLRAHLDEDSVAFVEDMTFIFGETKMKANRIEVYKGKGDTTIDTSFTVIGTIGFDFLVNRTLVLNYKENRWAITNKTIRDISPNISLVDNASVNRFPLLIPARIGDENLRFFFDTGSSMFSILTSVNNLKSMEKNAKIDTLCCVRQWTRQLKIYRKKIKNTVRIGGIEENSQYVFALENMSILDYFPASFLYGITGNKLFDNKLIIIDNKNNLFGVKN